MNKAFRTTLSLLVIISSSMVLSACFFSPKPPTPEELAEKTGEIIAKGGYAPKQSLALDSLHEVWRHDGKSLEISLLAPKTPGHYPLIIYLPGLGEHARRGGQLWRETWAKAGYTVFSIQPVDISEALKELEPMSGKSGHGESADAEDNDSESDDKDSRSSRTVRSSELRYLGHEYFSQVSLKQRISHVFWAYEQLKQRAIAGKPLFNQADLSRVIISGYDLGAQTVAAIIGETFEAPLPHDQDFKPIAAILLSPSVDMALGNLTSRYQAIAIPMLAVTASDDDDPYGISSPFVRTAIWEYAQPGDKYLLVLKKEGHQLLSGSMLSHRQDTASSEDSDEKPEANKAMPRFANAYGGGGRRNGGWFVRWFFGGHGSLSARWSKR